MFIKTYKKQWLSLIVMGLSLIFLAGFLILFINSSYKQQKADLQKEVGYLFVNSIRQIEGNVLNKLAFEDDSLMLHSLHIPKLRRDSLRIKAIIGIEDEKIPTKDRKIEIKINQESKISEVNQLEGSVSLFIAMKHDSSDLNDTSFLENGPDAFFEQLQKNFKLYMDAAGLPLQYQIKRDKVDSVIRKEPAISGSYTDVINGERYIAKITDYGYSIIKKILPELLFSILLFTSIFLAFIFTYRSLESERKLIQIKQNFIQNISHELKTPIATLSVAVEALQDFNEQDNKNKRSEYLELSKNELVRLSELVDKVLNFSIIEKSSTVNNSEPVNFKLAIEQIIQTLRVQFERQHIEVNLETIGLDFTVSGDRQRIDGLLYNLLDNAMKYNYSVNPIVELLLKAENNFVKFIIKDNGIGIPEEYQNKIFDKFFRVPNGDIHNVKGHGLGLSFVAEVVKEMNGEIFVESQQSVGTTFIISFPLYKF